MKRIAVLALWLAASAGGAPAFAQAAGVNPDLSAIAQFIACPQGADHCADTEADGRFELQEVELALQGYLNPFVRGDVFASYHAGDFEIEEAAATFVRGLGPFQAKLGKFRLDWGSINPLHPHAYSWIFQPLAEERFFGSEGLNQIAANLNLSIPLAERGELTVSGSVLRGDLAQDQTGAAPGEGTTPSRGMLCVGPGCADGLCQPGDTDCALVYWNPRTKAAESRGPRPAGMLRLSWFDEFRPHHSLLAGLSGLRGTLDPDLDRKVAFLGADAKYRWRPDKYRALNLIAAWIEARTETERRVVTATTCIGPDCVANLCPEGGVCREVETYERRAGETVTTSGWYALADWQFAARWNGGLKYDRSQGPAEKDFLTRGEVFVNFRLMEESTLFRLLVRREDGDARDEPETTTALQFVFSLGPHRPHQF